MALFGSSKKKGLLDLERDALAAPEPGKFTRLIEMAIAADNRAKAMEVARKALELFPEADSIRSAFQNLKRFELQPRIIELQNAISHTPSGRHYEMLAGLYHTDLGDDDKAYEVALEGLQQYPESDGLNLVAGLVRMSRFHKEFTANDFREAARHLQKAVEANAMNSKALVSLGRIYAEVGSSTRASEFLKKGCELNPGDERMEAVLQTIAAEPLPEPDTLDDVLREIELSGTLGARGLKIFRLMDPTAALPGDGKVDAAAVESYLRNVSGLAGFRCAVILRRDGSMVRNSASLWDKVEDLGRVVGVLCRESEEASRRMDIGGISLVDLDIPLGKLFLSVVGSLSLGVLADHGVQEGEYVEAVERFRSIFS
ncbi:MAG: hypothetical protein A2Z34_05530 [Planctomycetes bacterium RBG_16_59_8]|nr:MAG: hypothetical protein A2Z34_05530 [Planctomycetes bacterium RBG_16_59_8]